MRANPHLLRGGNLLWIRFFLLAVYATMYVRDHTRPMLHDAMGFESTAYDYEVFRITNEISQAGLPALARHRQPRLPRRHGPPVPDPDRHQCCQGPGRTDRQAQAGALAIAGVATFARLYMLPVKRHDLPQQVRMAPAW
jgi:magnesium-protoporphyrin IX monomethyl ester (oxidative) cyclase